jgi:imidazole glycerol-phosphate synthase subunit HisH
MEDVLIVNSGGANLASLQFALERLGASTRISNNAAEVASARRVILPGVGSAPHAMQRLHECDLTGVLPALACPVLGICLGMQLLYESSDEGPVQCLGVLPGAVRRLQPARGRPVPHMGWNQLDPLVEDPILEGVTAGEYVYFVHSFAVSVNATTLATSDYGTPLTAVARHENFWCTQFHPERSAAVGARILENFLKVQSCC